MENSLQLKHVPIESPAPGVMDSQSVFEPLTNRELKLSDALYQLGRGQLNS